jgi:hypothetical protein
MKNESKTNEAEITSNRRFGLWHKWMVAYSFYVNDGSDKNLSEAYF